MSNLSQLKAQVAQIANAATAVAGQLGTLSANLSQQIAQVSVEIGDTASGADKKMVGAFQQADTAVKSAMASMQLAATKANEWVKKA